MSLIKRFYTLGLIAFLTTLGYSTANAQQIKTVFVIAMENHNWTQSTHVPGRIEQIYGNTNAPFINSLVNGTAKAIINGSMVNIGEQVAYATAYHNVLATPNGNNPSIHPSEPNYIWAEAGTNFEIFNDDDPFKESPHNSQNISLHLSTLLTHAGKTWRSYQEDIDLTTVGTVLCDDSLSPDQWTVPLTSVSGHFGCGSSNVYNL